MVHTYTVTGMTCGGCEKSVKNQLLAVPGIEEAHVSKDSHSATLTMTHHIPISELQKSLSAKYQISPLHNELVEASKGWLYTYKPIALICGYLTIIALICAFENSAFYKMKFMNAFMAGFFLTFSFFKLLDLKSFAESYSMYDVVAKRFNGWGYAYAFIELSLGLAYATGFNPLLTNWVAFVVMTISIIGVLQSVLNKQKIQCACLGSVFKLPMSTVTIMEDALMIVMSGAMLGSELFT